MSRKKITRPYLLSAVWENHPLFDQAHLTSLIEVDGTKTTFLIRYGEDVRVHDAGDIEEWLTEQGCKQTIHQELPAHMASQSNANIRDRDKALAFRMRFA